MKKYFELLEKMPLFSGVSQEELSPLLTCLQVKVKNYQKNQIIFLTGQSVTSVGIVLEGTVHIIKEDVLGNRSILAELDGGELFAEAFCCARVEYLPVTALSVTPSAILLFDYSRIFSACSRACACHAKLIENMLFILATKNLLLNQKIEYLSKRSTREKLLAYLQSQAQKAGGSSFSIPFNRQELADYLCIDRSAMSNELGRLKDEGILTFHKSEFQLLSGQRGE